MRKLLLTMLSLMLLIFAAACGGEQAGDTNTGGANNEGNSEEATSTDVKTIRLGHVTQEGHPYDLAAHYFADLVTERTNGSLKFEIFPARQIGGDLDMLEMIQNGSLEAGFISSSVFSGSTPVLDGLQLPFLFDSYDTFGKAIQTETAQKMLDSLEELNLKGLGINESGMRNLGTNTAFIESPEDLQGIKIRIGESPLMVDIFRTLGADPTPMPYGEVYSGLQQGVIDAHEANLSAYVDENFYEVTEYITLSRHFPWPNVNVMNLDLFNSLTEEQQQILVEAGQETAIWIVQQLQKIDAEKLEWLEEKGSNYKEIENVDKFLEVVAPVYEKYAAKHPLIKEFVEEVEKIKAN